MKNHVTYSVLFDQHTHEFPQGNVREQLMFVGAVSLGKVYLDGFHDEFCDLFLVRITPK